MDRITKHGKVLSLRINMGHVKVMSEIREAKGISVTFQVNEALEQYLKKRG